jgi:hypothetical protein
MPSAVNATTHEAGVSIVAVGFAVRPAIGETVMRPSSRYQPHGNFR